MQLTRRVEDLAGRLPRARLEPVAVRSADDSARQGETWAVALSGGADSVALLLLVWAHWPEQRSHLCAFHFNHALRGTESDADEAFCSGLCAELSLPFHAGRWSRPAGEASEDEARVARFAYFAEQARRLGVRRLFTGHHLDDILETQLMRLGRGVSAAGLAAPRPQRVWLDIGGLLRPLLSLPKAEILSALRGAGLSWREDHTNTSGDYLRNRLRREVVPKWREVLGEGGLKGAGLTRRWLEEDDAALEWMLDDWGYAKAADALDLRPLAGKPPAFWRRALHRFGPAASLSRSGFETLLALCQAGQGRHSVADGFAIVENDQLRFEALAGPPEPWGPFTLEPRPAGAAEVELPDGALLQAERVTCDVALRRRLARKEVDPATQAYVDTSGEMHVRSWRPGDRFQPLGAPGSAKLQDLFTNRKIAASRRQQLPVICSADGRILWVPGFPPAEDSKMTDDSVTAVQLTYRCGTITVRKQS